MAIYKEIHKYNFEDREPIGENTSLFYRINKKQDTAGIIFPLYEEYEDPETHEIKKRLVLEDITITPSTATQVFYPDSQSGKVGFSEVTVNPIITGNIEITPSMEEQHIVPPVTQEGENTYFNSIDVKAIDRTIDDNIRSGNIRYGITILGVLGEYDGDKPLSISVDASQHIIHFYQSAEVNGTTLELEGENNISA